MFINFHITQIVFKSSGIVVQNTKFIAIYHFESDSESVPFYEFIIQIHSIFSESIKSTDTTEYLDWGGALSIPSNGSLILLSLHINSVEVLEFINFELLYL